MNEQTTILPASGQDVPKRRRKPRRVLTAEMIASMLDDARNGMTTSELCLKYGIVGSTLRKHCHEHGIQVARSDNNPNKARVMELVSSGERWDEAARKCGVSRQTAYYWMRKSGHLEKTTRSTTEKDVVLLLKGRRIGLSLKDAAALAGMHVCTASRICKRLGIPAEASRKCGRRGSGRKMSDATIEVLRLALTGFSRKYISEKSGVPYARVCATLSKYGITNKVRDMLIDDVGELSMAVIDGRRKKSTIASWLKSCAEEETHDGEQ